MHIKYGNVPTYFSKDGTLYELDDAQKPIPLASFDHFEETSSDAEASANKVVAHLNNYKEALCILKLLSQEGPQMSAELSGVIDLILQEADLSEKEAQPLLM